MLDDKKARIFMLMFMEDNLIKFFESKETSNELWKAIKEKYDTTTEVNTQLLLHRYNTCKMQEGDSVIEHVNKMIVMGKDLSTAGTEILKKMQVATILNSLSASLDMAATTLRMSGSNLTVMDLPARLVIEQDILARRKELEVNLEEANAIHRKFVPQKNAHVPKKPQFKNKFQNRKKIPTGACHNCGKYGHFKANCPNKQEGGYKCPGNGGIGKREFVGITECNAALVDSNE